MDFLFLISGILVVNGERSISHRDTESVSKFRVQSSKFRVQSSKFRVSVQSLCQSSEFKVQRLNLPKANVNFISIHNA